MFQNSSVGYGVVIKGDLRMVRIGTHSTVGDNTSIHESPFPLGPDHDGSTMIGHYVVIGSSCSLRGCTVENYCVIGSSCVLSPGSYMESNTVLEPRSVLQPDQRIPSGQVWSGNPAKFSRNLTPKELEEMEAKALDATRYAPLHAEQNYLSTSIYREIQHSQQKPKKKFVLWQD
uniref:Dynactin subunit 6 n=1 Tax=Arcella intermedia TaxID=1963864 RepID=A0A6B2LH82_9EUKA